MIDSGTARELVNRVQRLRKKAGLVPSDRIEVFLDAPAEILQVARTHSDLISHTISCPMLPASAFPAYMYALLSLQRCICFSAFLTCATRRAGSCLEAPTTKLQGNLSRFTSVGSNCTALPFLRESKRASQRCRTCRTHSALIDRHFSNFNEVSVMQFTVDGEKVSSTRGVHVTFGLPA
jgi:hypothetical protein